MFTDERSDDYTPIAVVGTFSIHATEFLLIMHVASMIALALWAAFSAQPLQATTLDYFLSYSPELILEKFQIWRLATYVLQNYPSLWFALGMLMLWWFGREVERFYGRRNFLICYGVLTVVPALLGLLPFLNFPLVGPSQVHFGIFILFAATYPSVPMFFRIEARWVAGIYLALFSLLYLASRSLSGLTLLWVGAFLAYGMTRWMGRGEWLPGNLQSFLPSFRSPQLTVVRSEPASSAPLKKTNDPVASIDPILEKIARSGLSSLTPREHAALRAASGELQKKSEH